jgi:N4-gp56 family major capsid protein
MAVDAFTDSTALTDTIVTAYERVAMFALRSELQFAQTANVRPGNLTSPGTPVQWTFWTDMTAATTALTETVDVNAVALADSTVSITPAEYGNAVLIPIRAKVDDFLVGFDPDVANLVAWNMVDSIDSLAQTAMDGGSNVDFVGQATEAAIVSTNVLSADETRQKHAELMTDNARPLSGGDFGAIIHPHQGYDLKGETGDGAWVAPAQYVTVTPLMTNEMGRFGGFRFVESPRVDINADGGSSTTDTYTAFFYGQDHLGAVESIPPHVVIGPVTDKLRRFATVGWHTYVGYDTIREASQRKLLSASAIGAN